MHTWSIIRPRRIQLNQLGPSWSWIELELSHDSISVSCASWAHLQEKLWRHTTTSHWFLQIAMYVSTLDKHDKVLQGDTGCHDWLPMPMKPIRSHREATHSLQLVSEFPLELKKKTLILITKPYSSSTWILREKWLEWSGVEWSGEGEGGPLRSVELLRTALEQ